MAAPISFNMVNLVKSSRALNSLLCQTNRVLTTCFTTRNSPRYVTSKTGMPQKPKRPMGKYMVFSQEKHPQVRAMNPDLSFTETAKEIARLWRELPDEERESYTAQAKQFMENYNEEMAGFKASLTEEDVKMIAQHKHQKKLMNINKKNRQVLTKLERPKRPLTAYGIFVQSQLSGISGNITSKMVAVGGEWKQMSEDEKSDYYTLASKARRDYQLAMDAWETKMADEGNISVVRKKSQLLERQRNKTEASKKKAKYEEEPF
ncbi:transcription factor A, mitochondrial-like [Asterias amurensis]|uniref:transcription factor A, mitochondrial-like n=1 Tax=Asterias amurensis TaxID=7602 RepID=UPI003AB3466D